MSIDEHTTNDDRVKVDLDDAISRLDLNDGRVHTFRDAGIALVGADWDLEDAVAAMRKYGVEESGAEASRMKHGLVLIDEHGPLFLETREARS
jgi:hypothetical protein